MTADLSTTFDALRALLKKNCGTAIVTVDKRGDFQVASKTMVDRIGRPLFYASVQVRKNYVTYHLLPIYMNPTLKDSLSPALKKRMQGKGCFNFTKVDATEFEELGAVTKKGIAGFKNVQLPWDTPKKK
jgi:hypothetical protein